jgi:hypothetical protein
VWITINHTVGCSQSHYFANHTWITTVLLSLQILLMRLSHAPVSATLQFVELGTKKTRRERERSSLTTQKTKTNKRHTLLHLARSTRAILGYASSKASSYILCGESLYTSRKNPNSQQDINLNNRTIFFPSHQRLQNGRVNVLDVRVIVSHSHYIAH